MPRSKKPACHVDDIGDRRAFAVDSEIKQANLARLRRIEGQVRGLSKMIEDDRYCPDILHQIVAVQQALRGVSRELIRNHLSHCVPAALKAGKAEGMADELAEIFQGLTK